MTTAAAGLSGKSGKTPVILKLALAALLILYALQLHSPLRINTDAAVILRLAADLTDGTPYMMLGARPIYPIGVPLTYSLMDRAHIATPFGFALLNFTCIGLAMIATWIICRLMRIPPIQRAAIVLISFSNYVLIKHSVIPLTDVPYFAVSLLCCAMLELFRERQGGEKTAAFLLSIFFAAASILTRRVGVTFIPAVLYALWPGANPRASFRHWLGADKPRALSIVALLLAIVTVAAILSRRLFYVPDWRFGDSVTQALGRQLPLRLSDFGELLLNFPSEKLGPLHPAVYAAGLLLAVLICTGLWRSRRNLRATHVYLMAYMAILIIWPFRDARFWIPVLPLVTLLVFQAVMPLCHFKTIRAVTAVYLAFYALTALAAMAYTTRLTFAAGRFPNVYGDETARAAYHRAASTQPTDPTDDWVFVIRRYGMGGGPR
jgi:hypothetical protein